MEGSHLLIEGDWVDKKTKHSAEALLTAMRGVILLYGRLVIVLVFRMGSLLIQLVHYQQ